MKWGVEFFLNALFSHYQFSFRSRFCDGIWTMTRCAGTGPFVHPAQSRFPLPQFPGKTNPPAIRRSASALAIR